MAQRQVTTICPDTGRTIWTYLDLGPGAAKPAHGQGPAAGRLNAVGLGKFVAPGSVTISNPRGGHR